MIILFVPVFFCCFGISAGQTTNYTINDKGVCGIRAQDDDPERVRVIPTIPGRVPWHVGLYKYDTNSNMNELICGGTIISLDIVLTAATCVYDPVSKKAYNPNLFRITAGKLTFNWSSSDSDAQEMTVKEIVIPQTFLDNLSSKVGNVALLKLTADLNLNDSVRPVCFDLNTSNYNIKNRYFQTAGWGLDGGVSKWPFLKEANFQYLSNAECTILYSADTNLRSINEDEICLLTPGGRTEYDTGGGLFYKMDNKYHLIGVMSDYMNNEFTPATNLSGHLTWINNTVEQLNKFERCKDGFLCLDGTCIEKMFICDDYKDCPDGTDEAVETCPSLKPENNPKDSCLLPTVPGGESYTKQFCVSNCELKGGEYIAQNQQAQLDCNKGFAPKEIGLNAVYICIQGRWFPQNPECIKLCSPLKEPNIMFHCTYKGEDVNCDTFMKPGTIAKYSCSEHYTMVNSSAYSGSVSCVEGGIWKDPIPKCNPVCGVENPANLVELTIAYGNITKYGKYPWHVAIYIHFKGDYENICGGTLISENMVLTAAHCVYSAKTKGKLTFNMTVAAGKFYRNLDKQEEYEQISRVSKILVPEAYAGAFTQLEQDVGLIITEKSFKFNDFVLPVCVDYSQSLNPLEPNTTGTLLGWGMTEKGEYSNELREVQLPIINAEDCRKIHRVFIPFITWDKFCVPFINGSGPIEDDDGGGFTIKRQGLHLLYGIISSTAKMTTTGKEYFFTIVTNVSTQLDWVKEKINVHSRQLKLL